MSAQTEQGTEVASSMSSADGQPSGGGRAKPSDLVRTGIFSLVLIIMAFLALVPLLYLVWTSLSPNDGSGGLTLANYVRLLSSGRTYALLYDSLVFGIGSTAVACTVGLSMAWLTARTDVPGKRLLVALMAMPLVIPGILYAISWVFLLGPRQGVINVLLRSTGLEAMTLDVFTRSGMAIVQGFNIAPLTYLLMYAVLRQMDSSMEEAASVSGASSWQGFRRITLGLLKPQILAVALITFILSIEAFEVPAILGLPGGVQVLTTSIWLGTQTYPPDLGGVSVLAMLLLAISVFGLVVQSQRKRSSRMFATVTGKAFKPKGVPLGRYRSVAGGAAWCYILVSLFLPLGLLLWMSLQPYYVTPSFAALDSVSLESYRTVSGLPLVRRAMANSVLLGIGAGFSVMTLTVVAAWISVKSRWRFAGWVDQVAFAPIVLPGLIIGLALMVFYLRTPIPIYGTLWILLIAYATKYMPYGMRYASGSLIQINDELEEAGRTSGASWIKGFVRITLPLIMPGLISGFIYVFLVSSRELSASVLLYGLGSEVLSVAILSLWENGQFSLVSALGVMMLVVLLILTAIAQSLLSRLGVKS